MELFFSRPFWLNLGIPLKKVYSRFEELFGDEEKIINDPNDAKTLLTNVISETKRDLLTQAKNNPTKLLFSLHFIFGEIHSLYIEEKKQRAKLASLSSTGISDTLNINKNIMRDIIDATNIWIENCILFQKENETYDDIIKAKNDGYWPDVNLLIDIYLYGFASHSLSLIVLSQKLEKNLSFKGLKITPNSYTPAELLKYHPIIYYNDLIIGNQDLLSDATTLSTANESSFGLGFEQENGVKYLLFLASIRYMQRYLLNNDDKSLIILTTDVFQNEITDCTNPKIKFEDFYKNFVLSKEKVQSQLGNKDDSIWKMGCNKYRYELRPIIDMGNNFLFVSYAALNQCIMIWNNYFLNGGIGYTNIKDELTAAIMLRNNELSNELLSKIILILNNNYSEQNNESDSDNVFCKKDVDYDKIFGEKPENYGDYDIIYYSYKTKELYLIEAKYFSDSLTASGVINDYEKMFRKGGYYEHCRKRYNLVMAEPEKLKSYIGLDINEKIEVHLLFVSSKSLELELQDNDGIVTFLSLSNFDSYIKGKFIAEDNSAIVRPTHII